MTKVEPKPTQVRIEGVRLSTLFEKGLFESLKRDFPGVRFSHLTMEIPLDTEGKKNDSVTIGHFTREHEANAILAIDCDEPETVKKLVQLVERSLGDADG